MENKCIFENWLINKYKNIKKKFHYYAVFFAMLEHKLLLSVLSIIGIGLIIWGFNVTGDNSLNSLLINIGSGIESSILFYILVVAFPIYHRSRKLSKSVYYRIHNLSCFPPTFIKLVEIANKKSPLLTLDMNNLTDGDIEQLCKVVFTLDRIEFNVLINGGFQLASITVLDHIEAEINKTKEEIKNILYGLASFLDDQLVIYLNELYYDTEINVLTHSFFTSLKGLNNQNICGFQSTLKNLYKWSKKLREHNNKYYKD